ncbi:PAS domain S-box protein [Emcibacter sp. SYSU 3D8]|uniref:PAS domain-containing hybrid sensor histidine kinase/response regulator n=1 Tax=Emcibacter sp. SYSU 3D8 TaxID=3133969 RepID=UPI0031FEA6E3
MTRISKWEISVAAALLLTGAVLIFAANFYGTRLEERRLRDLAVMAAASLEAADVAALAASTDYDGLTGTREFRDIRAALARMRQSIPDSQFIYLIAKSAGDWRFLADAGTVGSADYSPPGQIYRDDASGFETVLRTGQPFVEPMAEDQWGVWVSGEAPILDPATGKTVAVLGIDVDARDWIARVWGYRAAGAGVAMLIAVIAALFAIGRRRQERNIRALAALEDSTRTIMNAAAVGLMTIDENGIIRSFNPEAERIFGYAENDAVGANVSMLMPEPEQKAHDGHIARFLGSGSSNVVGTGTRELLGRRKDGKTFPMELSVAQMTTGGRTHFVGSIQDVSERKATEESLRQAQKMETLSNLTGGVAHDINNMLMSVQTNLELVEDHLGDDPAAVDSMSLALEALKHGAELSNRLLAFSRKQPLQLKVTNINTLVGDTFQQLKRTLPDSINVRTSLAGDAWSAEVDPTQLANSLVSLAFNARDAMPGGGILRVETSNTRLDEADVADMEGLRPGDYVSITVTDNGCGMPPAVAARSFDPFFTTKPAGQGSGLGLSMVYGFAKQSGGHVSIESEEGKGTSVRMLFPRTGAQSLAQIPVRTRKPAQAQGETILLVEDEPTVRAGISRILGGLGYIVHGAGSGPEAMDLIDGGLAPDLILADVVLPAGMSGPEVASAVVARVPSCKVLFMSGYTDNIMGHEGRLDPGVELLTKPFPRAAIAAKLREILDVAT